jgi:uncharacterized protein YciI
MATTTKAQEFVVIKDVPIIDEHLLRDEDGQPVKKIGYRELVEIANRGNQRVRDTGDEAPIVIGHTKDGLPEHLQPPVVGFARDFKVGRLGKTGRKAVLATFRLLKKHLDLIRKYPRRSVELWLEDWTIDPISLLGASTPERDLGLLKLHAKGPSVRTRPFSNHSLLRPRRLAKTPANMNDDKQTLVQEILAALEETDVFQWAKQQMKRMGEDKVDTASEEAAMDNDLEVEDEAHLEDDLMAAEDDLANLEEDTEEEYEAEEDYAEHTEEPIRESSRMKYASAASGTNTFIPGGSGVGAKKHNTAGKNEHGKPQKSWNNAQEDAGGPIESKGKKEAGTSKAKAVYRTDQDTLTPTGSTGGSGAVYPTGGSRLKQAKQLARSGSTIRLARMERALAASQQQMTELKVKLQRATREKDLIELEALGYDLDRTEELDFVQALPEEQYQKHLDRIKAHYTKAPLPGFGPDPVRYARSSASPRAAQGLSKERAREVADYATRRGISFAAALDEMGATQETTY